MARAQADQEEAAPIELKPLRLPPEKLSREQVLKRRLQHVQELKNFYTRANMSMLAHLVDLAGAMKQAQRPILHAPAPQPARSTGNDGAAGATPSGKDGAEVMLSPSTAGVASPKAASRGEGPALGLTSPASNHKAEVTSPRLGFRPEGVARSASQSSLRSGGLPAFSDAEDEVLRQSERSKNGGAAAHSVLLDRLSKSMCATSALQMISSNLEGLADHERLASAASCRDMDAHEACAVLCGRNTRFYLHQTIVIIGRRSKSKGEVDVDLTLEGPTTRLSRIQCLLELDLEIGFVLRNLGRQSVLANNVEVRRGHKIKVPHLSLLEIGGISVMFFVNHDAVRRIALQKVPCPLNLGQHAWA